MSRVKAFIVETEQEREPVSGQRRHCMCIIALKALTDAPDCLLPLLCLDLLRKKSLCATAEASLNTVSTHKELMFIKQRSENMLSYLSVSVSV